MHKNVKILASKPTPSQKKVYSEITKRCMALIETHDDAVAALGKRKKIDPVWVDEKMMVLSGPAGTGKTFLTAKIIKKLSAKYTIAATAPTHKAVSVIAENLQENGIYGVQCKTIQSFLAIKAKKNYITGDESYEPDKDAQRFPVDLLIVDECSMVDAKLFSHIELSVHQEYCKAVLFVGDFYQLPPINSNESPASRLQHQYTLTDIVRQAAGSYIIEVATALRKRIEEKNFIPPLEFFREQRESGIHFFSDAKKFTDDFCFEENWDRLDRVVATYRRKEVAYYNDRIRRRYWKERKKKSPGQLEVGDEIIFLEPNIDRNGVILHHNNDHATVAKAERLWSEKLKLWYWKCVDRSNLPFMVIDDQSRKHYERMLKDLATQAKKERDREKKRKLWSSYFLLKDSFVKVQHRFALTIHKLQGSTYDTVYINLYDMVKRVKNLELIYRLMYVAITRASTDVKILMPPLDEAEALHTSIAEIEESFDEIADLLG